MEPGIGGAWRRGRALLALGLLLSKGNAVLDPHHSLYRNKAFQHLWQESHQLPYVTLLRIC